MPNDSTKSAQLKSWTSRSKSRILQQDLLSRSNTLDDTTAISPLLPVTSSTSTNPKTKLPKPPKRSHTQASNSKPDSQNVDNSFTSTSLPPSNAQFPTSIPQVNLNHLFLLLKLFPITTIFLQLNPCKLKKLQDDQFALTNPTLGLFTRLSLFHLLIINS